MEKLKFIKAEAFFDSTGHNSIEVLVPKDAISLIQINNNGDYTVYFKSDYKFICNDDRKALYLEATLTKEQIQII